MENNINISAIELYARKALKPFLDKFLSSDKIGGKEILSFCPIEQVNFFVLHQLFAKWQEETSKLRSPYFDFENQQVQDALKVFMAQLSQHILVSKDAFTPLLLQAINNTVHFVVAPISFLEQHYLQSDKTYSEEELKGLFKYLKANADFKTYLNSQVSLWNGKTGAYIVDALIQEFQISYVDIETESAILAMFNEVLPAESSDFRYKEHQKTHHVDEIKETPRPIAIQDILAKEAKPTVLNMHMKNKVVDIRSAMSLNQRIMFIKELFKGDTNAFEGAMALADASQTYEKCVNSLIDAYSQRFDWEIDSEEVNELFDLIGRKFYPETFSEKD